MKRGRRPAPQRSWTPEKASAGTHRSVTDRREEGRPRQPKEYPHTRQAGRDARREVYQPPYRSSLQLRQGAHRSSLRGVQASMGCGLVGCGFSTAVGWFVQPRPSWMVGVRCGPAPGCSGVRLVLPRVAWGGGCAGLGWSCRTPGLRWVARGAGWLRLVAGFCQAGCRRVAG
jgi:hypothetical protein